MDSRVFNLCVSALLGLVTVTTAFCAYQTAMWQWQESELEHLSLVARTQSQKASLTAMQEIGYDTMLFMETVRLSEGLSLGEGGEPALEHYTRLRSLLGPDMLNALKWVDRDYYGRREAIGQDGIDQVWLTLDELQEKMDIASERLLEMDADGAEYDAIEISYYDLLEEYVITYKSIAERSFLDSPTYREAKFSKADDLTAKADADYAMAQQAEHNGKRYMLLSVFLSTSLFFGGMAAVAAEQKQRLFFILLSLAIYIFCLIGTLTGNIA